MRWEHRSALRDEAAITPPKSKDLRLCAAIVDRLTFGGNIIETGTEFYRLAGIRAARATAAS
ncbi:hypothetical protein STVIR_0073 [Streptomyces viridochromogenes Tue57]|uniref:Uncharacterized protein n=1 Tax=Streptomyces viridochromogenes Tue57 TaxID=1160705 RepID=L8PMX7_STRVR|nr:hypothetical protein STVIR_0073 [Streptomyces viridochromogenes Tue57]